MLLDEELPIAKNEKYSGLDISEVELHVQLQRVQKVKIFSLRLSKKREKGLFFAVSLLLILGSYMFYAL